MLDLVQLVTRFIVKSYLGSVVNALAKLYARREAASQLNDPARPMLARARLHMTRVGPGYRGNPLGVRCGNPLGDQSKLFALMSVVLMGVAWVVVPIALGVSFLV